MTVCYGIKCISNKPFEPISTAGRGGWTLGPRGLVETWCKTFVFPFYDINEVYHEFHKWGQSTLYSYVVEEIPPTLLPSLLDNAFSTENQFTLLDIDTNTYYNPLQKIEQDTIKEIQEQEDKRFFDLIDSSFNNNTTSSKPVKHDKPSGDDLKKALQKIVKYAYEAEAKKVKSYTDGYGHLWNKDKDLSYKNITTDGYGWTDDEYSLGGEF